MRHGRLRGCLLVIACFAGCARQADQGSAPPPSAESPAESAAPAAPTERLLSPPRTALAPPRTATAAPPRATTIRVFYGTNRAPSGDPQPKTFYGSTAAGLTFGHCDVSLPPNHESGELESPRLWRFEFKEDPDKHIVLQRVQPLEGPEFITELQRAVWNSIEWRGGNRIIGGDVLLFVHGFNNSFEDAARRHGADRQGPQVPRAAGDVQLAVGS